jgi:hypothetical protein
MVGTQAPQKLFGDFPAAVSQIPGMVTPNTSVSMPSYVDWAGITEALTAQEKLKQASADRWARAAAINNARAAQGNAGWNQGHDLPGTASQTSGMGYGQSPNNQGPVLWAPRNLQGPKLGTWASQQQSKAVAENREMPTVLQAHANDPYSPGEVGGGGASNVLGRGIYGPGLTSAMGAANPALWARMWSRRTGQSGGGGTSQGEPVNPFPEESLRQRTSPSSSGPQYRFDLFGGR